MAMMNLDKIQIVVSSRGGPMCRPLQLWLASLPVKWRYGSPDYRMEAARNQNVDYFLKRDVPRGKKYLLLLDDDMVPVIDTNRIISADGDLIYCGYADREGSRGHHGDGDFGVACSRISASLLRRMEPPWFKLGYNEEWIDLKTDDAGNFIGGHPPMTVRLHCDCWWFLQQAKQLGAEPKMVGIVGHLQQCVIFPDPDSKLGWKIAWPHEV